MSHRLHAASLLAVTVTGLALGQASAADLDALYGQTLPLQQERVEFGSGWYIRGDIGVQQNYSINASGVAPQVAPTLSFQRDHTPGYDLSLGAGYKFTNAFRAELNADFLQPRQVYKTGASLACPLGVYGTPVGGTFTGSAFTYGTCTPNVYGSLRSYDAMVNAYYDIGTWYGVTPYIGAGAGVSFGHYTAAAHYYAGNGVAYNFNYTDPFTGSSLNINYDKSSSGSYHNLAFAAMAGISFDVFDHAKLDIGYRYLNLGSVMGSTIYYHQVRAGLRYMIDN